jgi:hypothetical protein
MWLSGRALVSHVQDPGLDPQMAQKYWNGQFLQIKIGLMMQVAHLGSSF